MNWSRFTFITASMLLAGLLAGSALAGNGKGPKNKEDGGDSSDTSDPDYLISAIRTTSPEHTPGLFLASGECKGVNPDLKGPGIAYLGFFPEGCTVVTTDGAELDRVAIFVEQNEEKEIVALEFRAFVGNDRATGYHVIVPPPGEALLTPPAEDDDPQNDDANFVIDAQASFDMELCTKRRGKTTCGSIGFVHVDLLDYEFVSF